MKHIKFSGTLSYKKINQSRQEKQTYLVCIFVKGELSPQANYKLIRGKIIGRQLNGFFDNSSCIDSELLIQNNPVVSWSVRK